MKYTHAHTRTNKGRTQYNVQEESEQDAPFSFIIKTLPCVWVARSVAF